MNAAPKNKLTSLFEDAAPASVKEPVDKADLADINNAQAVIPYLADIQRHYREAEVRHRPRHRPARAATSAPCSLHLPAAVLCSLKKQPREKKESARGPLARPQPRDACLSASCAAASAHARAVRRCSSPRLARPLCSPPSPPPPFVQGINLASATFMTKQTDINEKMRAILIDWLVEVHLKFKLMPETLYLTVNLIDRFLEKETIARNKLQLVGVTAMFIASKYEEIYAPECRDFVYISDKAYTREQILQMEGLMLSKLNFQLTTPNALVFMKRFAKVAGILATPRTKTELLTNYLVELTLQEYKMLKYLPSTIAAASTYLALKTMGQQAWTPELVQHACYTEAAIMPCVRDINALHKNAAANNLQAVRKKYAQEKHGSVSGIPPASV